MNDTNPNMIDLTTRYHTARFAKTTFGEYIKSHPDSRDLPPETEGLHVVEYPQNQEPIHKFFLLDELPDNYLIGKDLTFEQVLPCLKQGFCIARKSWTEMRLLCVPPVDPLPEYIFVLVNNHFIPWTPSPLDILATDWKILT